jgi:hypothetical protein
MEKSNTGWYVLGGAVVLVLVLVVVAGKSSSRTTNTTQLSGGAAWLTGAGSLAAGLGKGLGDSGIFKKDPETSGGGYTPNVTRGEDQTLGG